MQKLLEPLPAAIVAEIRKLVTMALGGQGMRYDAETKKAFWLQRSADGMLTVITFPGIASLEIAAELWTEMARCTEPLNMASLSALYAQVTAQPVEVISNRH
jgi:hypothetical protein